MLKGPSLIAIAIFIGGIVFIAGGIILFSGVANFSDSVKDKFQVNATSGVRSMIAKSAANALEPVINAFTQITKGNHHIISLIPLFNWGRAMLSWNRVTQDQIFGLGIDYNTNVRSNSN